MKFFNTKNQQPKTNDQSGQVLIVLLLLLLVLLAAGLAITQRSTTDLSISTQTEQASRAFSAAEAGIDQALTTGNSTIPETVLGNSSRATIRKVPNLPLPGMALEYPVQDLAERGLDTFDKENFAQFWLANPNSLGSGNCAPATPACGYPSNTAFEVDYGDISVTSPNTDTSLPAVEIKVITRDATGAYNGFPYYYDSVSSRNNGFINLGAGFTCGGYTFPTNLSFSTTDNRSFLCRITIDSSRWPGQKPILVRIRMLYHSGHPLAVRPLGGNSLPVQGEIITSTGFAGQSQKRIQLFRESYVFPPFFDFAIFSSGNISK